MPQTVRTIEALGYRWTMEPSDIEADQGHANMMATGRAYAYSLKRPASIFGAFGLISYYADVLGATVEVEPLEPVEGFDSTGWLLDMVDSPKKWVDFARAACKDLKAQELGELQKLALSLNPHWMNENVPVPTEETSEAETIITNTLASIDLDNPNPPEKPDSATIEAAAEILVDAAEAKAKEAGKVGPATFPGKKKRA